MMDDMFASLGGVPVSPPSSPPLRLLFLGMPHSTGEFGDIENIAWRTFFINETLFDGINATSLHNFGYANVSAGAASVTGGADKEPNGVPVNSTRIGLYNSSGGGTIIIESGIGLGIGEDTVKAHEDIIVLAKMTAMSIVLGLMILITIIGNVFVIAAIILERNLQNVANYLVASLAVADLLVACLVMPLGAVYEISEGWILGAELCDIWTSCDVLCCTASILHLVAIAADRYWTVTDIDYTNLRTPKRVFLMIFCVWFAALIVSLAPQFGWKDPEYMQRIDEQKCMVSQDVGYQIFATCCTFYVPLLIILVLYWKIYKIARKRIKRRAHRPHHPHRALPTGASKNQANNTSAAPPPSRQQRRLKICFGNASESYAGKSHLAVPTLKAIADTSITFVNAREETEFSTSNFDNKSHAGTEVTETNSSDADELRSMTVGELTTVSQQVATSIAAQHHVATIALSTTHLTTLTSTCNQLGSGDGTSGQAQAQNSHQKLVKRRQILEAKRERKAAQTLAIITGAFVVCWLPFFVMALLLPLCKNCHMNAMVASFFLWLGYFNSTLNPVIYTIFNPEFRRAFKRILFGRRQMTLHCRSGRL